MSNKVAFIDLDGTVFEPNTKDPLPGALDSLRSLRDDGYLLVYFTCRPLPTPPGCPDEGWPELLIREGLSGAYMHKPFACEYIIIDDKLNLDRCATHLKSTST